MGSRGFPASPNYATTFNVALPGDLQAFSPSGWLEVAMEDSADSDFPSGPAIHSCPLRQDRFLILTLSFMHLKLHP